MISAWTSHGRILSSYRKNGVLDIRDIGGAEYVGFIKKGTPHNLLDDPGVLSIRDDFPGWQKVAFVDYDSRKACLENNPRLLFEADVPPVRRFLTDNFCKIDPPRRVFLDIETDSRVPFSQALVTGTRLLSFALVDEENNKHVLGLEDDDDQAEAELWGELWRLMGEYDQVCAWSGDRFDFQVMKIQCEKYARRFKRILDPYWDHRRRIQQVDQMLCFKRHHMAAESGDEKTSLRLNDVCEALFGEGKNDFDSSKTWEAWSAGGAARQELLDYNLQDTALLNRLEQETGYLALQQTIAEVTLTFVNTHTLKPMPWIDAYLLKMAHKLKTHLPSKHPGENGADVEGAIVIPPRKLGVHENVHVCDFKSLYPTVIRTWNLGSETILDGPAEGACKAANGHYFRTDQQSMLSMFCEEMMNGRDKYKKEMKKHPPGTPAWKDVERKSKAFKIANNSGFGVTGNPFFRLYDPRITDAIISGARVCLLTVEEAAVAANKDALYGDTDSLFVCGGTVAEFDDFVKRCNSDHLPKMLDTYGCRQDFRVIELAYEKQFARLVFPLGKDGTASAKRYAGLYAHYGGKAATADSKPEIRGLEWMRTDSTRGARHMQRDAIEMILRGRVTSEEAEEWVKRRRQLFFEGEVPLEDIVLSKGISRPLDAYKTVGPHVRIASALAEAGEDIGEGTRISYVVTDGSVSPATVIPASEYKGQFDRYHYWNKAYYSATLRVLAGAFPDRNWLRWVARRPRKVPVKQLSLIT